MTLSMALHNHKQEEGGLQVAEGVWDSLSLSIENAQRKKETVNKILSVLNTHPSVESRTE